MRFFLAVMTVWFWLAPAAWAQEGDALQRFLADLKTWHADFEQNQFDEAQSLLESSRGVVDLQRPGKFRWAYQSPYRQLIVADGEQIWIYDEDLEQVTLKDFDAALGNTPALLLTSERDLNEAFAITALPEENGTSRFELTPKDEHAQFHLLRLGFAADTLQSLELQDNLGQTTLITFSQAQRNPPLPAELFGFTPPQGIDIIDGRE